MTDAGPIERVVNLLVRNGYSAVEAPVVIGGVPFEFSALLVGGSRAFDIVVVIDTVSEEDRRLRQKVEALARTLDVVRSRRSLTVVTVGPDPGRSAIAAISRVARVLIVGAAGEDDAPTLRDMLSVLLPLELPSVSSEGAEPFHDLEAWLAVDLDRRVVAPLVLAAHEGATPVQHALTDLLTEPLAAITAEDQT